MSSTKYKGKIPGEFRKKKNFKRSSGKASASLITKEGATRDAFDFSQQHQYQTDEFLKDPIYFEASRIDLSHNLLVKFGAGIYLPRLKYLSLSHNSIKEVQFAGLKSLMSLVLSHNQLAALADTADLSKLVNLDLSYNPLKSGWNHLAKLKSLKVLDLGYCGLDYNFQDFFNNVLQYVKLLPKLQFLNLHGNTMTHQNEFKYFILNQLPELKCYNWENVSREDRSYAGKLAKEGKWKEFQSKSSPPPKASEAYYQSPVESEEDVDDAIDNAEDIHNFDTDELLAQIRDVLPTELNRNGELSQPNQRQNASSSTSYDNFFISQNTDLQIDELLNQITPTSLEEFLSLPAKSSSKISYSPTADTSDLLDLLAFPQDRNVVSSSKPYNAGKNTAMDVDALLDDLFEEYALEGDKTDIQESEYTLISRVSQGSYGESWKGKWNKTSTNDSKFILVKKLYDINIFEGEKDTIQDFRNECKKLMDLKHDNLIKVLGASSPVKTVLWEFCTGTTLKDYVKINEVYPRTMVINVVRSLGKALGHLHHKGIIHGSVKSSNVFIMPDNTTKLTDYGFMDWKDGVVDFIDPQYMAPELFNGESYREKIDVYSFGMLLYELAAGEQPFSYVPEDEISHIVTSLNKRPELPQATPVLYKKITHLCWATDPEQRPSFHSINDQLTKPEEVLFPATIQFPIQSRTKQPPTIDFIPDIEKVSPTTGLPIHAVHPLANIKQPLSITPRNAPPPNQQQWNEPFMPTTQLPTSNPSNIPSNFNLNRPQSEMPQFSPRLLDSPPPAFEDPIPPPMQIIPPKIQSNPTPEAFTFSPRDNTPPETNNTNPYPPIPSETRISKSSAPIPKVEFGSTFIGDPRAHIPIIIHSSVISKSDVLAIEGLLEKLTHLLLTGISAHQIKAIKTLYQITAISGRIKYIAQNEPLISELTGLLALSGQIGKFELIEQAMQAIIHFGQFTVMAESFGKVKFNTFANIFKMLLLDDPRLVDLAGAAIDTLVTHYPPNADILEEIDVLPGLIDILTKSNQMNNRTAAALAVLSRYLTSPKNLEHFLAGDNLDTIYSFTKNRVPQIRLQAMETVSQIMAPSYTEQNNQIKEIFLKSFNVSNQAIKKTGFRGLTNLTHLDHPVFTEEQNQLIVEECIKVLDPNGELFVIVPAIKCLHNLLHEDSKQETPTLIGPIIANNAVSKLISFLDSCSDHLATLVLQLFNVIIIHPEVVKLFLSSGGIEQLYAPLAHWDSFIRFEALEVTRKLVTNLKSEDILKSEILIHISSLMYYTTELEERGIAAEIVYYLLQMENSSGIISNTLLENGILEALIETLSYFKQFPSMIESNNEVLLSVLQCLILLSNISIFHLPLLSSSTFPILMYFLVPPLQLDIRAPIVSILSNIILDETAPSVFCASAGVIPSLFGFLENSPGKNRCETPEETISAIMKIVLVMVKRGGIYKNYLLNSDPGMRIMRTFLSSSRVISSHLRNIMEKLVQMLSY